MARIAVNGRSNLKDFDKVLAELRRLTRRRPGALWIRIHLPDRLTPGLFTTGVYLEWKTKLWMLFSCAPES
jgi:hypothetical protein